MDQSGCLIMGGGLCSTLLCFSGSLVNNYSCMPTPPGVNSDRNEFQNLRLWYRLLICIQVQNSSNTFHIICIVHTHSTLPSHIFKNVNCATIDLSGILWALQFFVF